MNAITVGSSDVASILGISPWSSPSKTWARLTGLIERYEGGDSASTARGRIIEPALLGEWRRLRSPAGWTSGPTIESEPRIRDGWKHAREDMLAVMEDGRTVIVEAKTTRGWDGWGDSGTQAVPVYYVAQVVWQMHVLDVDACEVVAFSPLNDEVRMYPFARDLGVEGRLVGAVHAWMGRHVWADPPVPPGDMPLDVVEALHRHGGGDKTWLDADDDAIQLATKLVEARARLAAVEAEEKALRARLCERVGDAYGIKGVCTWGQVRGRETVNATELKAEFPEVYAKLAKRGASHRMFKLNFKESTE